MGTYSLNISSATNLGRRTVILKLNYMTLQRSATFQAQTRTWSHGHPYLALQAGRSNIMVELTRLTAAIQGLGVSSRSHGTSTARFAQAFPLQVVLTVPVLPLS